MPRSVTEQEVYYVIYLEYAYEYFPPNIRLWGFSTYFGLYPTLGNEPKIIFFFSFKLGRIYFCRQTQENFMGLLYLHYSLDLYPCIGTKPRNEAYAHVSSWPVSLMGPNQERKCQEQSICKYAPWLVP
jgi:hypothetical protein